jgi:hypothetical protein
LAIEQAGRIGRRNIDREIVRDIRERRDPAHIIIHTIARIFVGAEIDPDDSRSSRTQGEARVDGRMALAGEAETVDYCLVAIEAK